MRRHPYTQRCKGTLLLSTALAPETETKSPQHHLRLVDIILEREGRTTLAPMFAPPEG